VLAGKAKRCVCKAISFSSDAGLTNPGSLYLDATIHTSLHTSQGETALVQQFGRVLNV
jgi:hypothetical protein